MSFEGNTLIEKLTKYLNPSSFVCVLLTPDDRGGLITEDPKEYRPRARQNVILELGWAIGKLGRDHVVIIRKNSVDKPCENPSDLDGIVDIRYDESVEEIKHELAKELATAGFKVDFIKL